MPGVRRARRSPRESPGTTSNGIALLVQEQRFLAAAVEHERIAPLQPRDGLAFARLLREQVADRFLLERLRRRRADVDVLGVRRAPAQQPRVDVVVVDDDVGRLEVAQPAHGDQAGIAGAGADDVDAGSASCRISPSARRHDSRPGLVEDARLAPRRSPARRRRARAERRRDPRRRPAARDRTDRAACRRATRRSPMHRRAPSPRARQSRRAAAGSRRRAPRPRALGLERSRRPPRR